MKLTVGTTLDSYELKTFIGAGGMGEVYRAKDTRFDREVAIKVLLASMANNPEALRRFTREVRAIAALTHPNIPLVYDMGTYQGRPFLVMELLEGETLRALLQRERMTWQNATQIALAIADGLAAAHAKGIAHRDIKPENILLGANGVVKILDFGLAKFDPAHQGTKEPTDSTITVETRLGTLLGTPHYMSPEQVRGAQADAQSDIFSFGCVLYEMLTGEHAFERDSTAEIMAAIVSEDPPLPGGSMPGELRQILTSCLAKDPSQRFRSAAELALALTAVGRGAHRSKPMRKLCVCGRSGRVPFCDGTHVAEGWTCSHEADWARFGFCASDRFQNLAFKLASRYQGALCLPGEPWPRVERLVTIVDGTDLEFPMTALREIHARDRLVVTLGVPGEVLQAAVGGCQIIDLAGASLFDAFTRITKILDGEEQVSQRPGAPVILRSAFISHAIKDEPTIMPVITYLRRYFQADLFLCADSVPPSSVWQDVILNALRSQGCFIALLSQVSLASHFCSFEIGAASAMDKPIALMSLDGCRPPVFVQHIQAIDLPRMLQLEPWLEIQDVLLRELLRVLADCKDPHQDRVGEPQRAGG